MKKAGSFMAGERWSFFHGPDLDPPTGTVLLGHPGPVQTCRLPSAPLQCSLPADRGRQTWGFYPGSLLEPVCYSVTPQ